MSAGPRIVLLGLAGLAAATLLGLAAHLVTRETIALPATSLSAGDSLAPADVRSAGHGGAARPGHGHDRGHDAPGGDHR